MVGPAAADRLSSRTSRSFVLSARTSAASWLVTSLSGRSRPSSGSSSGASRRLDSSAVEPTQAPARGAPHGRRLLRARGVARRRRARRDMASTPSISSAAPTSVVDAASRARPSQSATMLDLPIPGSPSSAMKRALAAHSAAIAAAPAARSGERSTSAAPDSGSSRGGSHPIDVDRARRVPSARRRRDAPTSPAAETRPCVSASHNTSLSPDACIRRAARLTCGPTTAKSRRRALPTGPHSAGPVASPDAGRQAEARIEPLAA